MAETVFGSDYSAAYDALYADKDYDAECQMIEDAIARFGTGKATSISDWGCGTGSHSLRLAAKGYEIGGADLSAGMLEKARLKAQALPPGAKVEFRQGDIASVGFGRKFDAAVMMFAVLGYQTTNEGLLATLRNVRAHLDTGGIFIADVWFGPTVLTVRPGERVRVLNENGRDIVRAASTTLDIYNHLARVNFNLWVHEGDRLVARSAETHVMRYFFPQELRLLLSDSGFELVSLTAFPSLDKPVSDQIWDAVVVARAV